MNNNWSPSAIDAKRIASVILHPTATLLQVISQTATDGVDLSIYVTTIKQTSNEVSFTVTWNTELDGSNQPEPGQVLEVKLNGQQLWVGVIESLNDYRLERGQRTLAITARSRDANPLWRDTQRVSGIYPAGTWLSTIGYDIALALGMTSTEILLPDLAVTTVHSNTQMANVTAWQMLETLYQPSGMEPFVDANGRLKAISKDTTRAADIVLSADRIKSINGSRSRVPATAIRIKWLDPRLTEVAQQDQALATETLTAGFFQPQVTKNIYFSADRLQRAKNTYMKIKQSVNSGLIKAADESYEQGSETDGLIVLKNTYYSPTFISAALYGAMNAGSLPDYTTPGGGPTIPTGKIAQASLLFAAMYTMSSMGTGTYEIRGTPYDFVHARNITEAYDDSSPDWTQRIVEIENDFVMNQTMSEAYASRELLYEVRKSTSYGVTIVDDPRIEPGDILQLSDGSRLYVTGYTRDLTRGAAALLDVQGFKV
jgi:hypothetical protein